MDLLLTKQLELYTRISNAVENLHKLGSQKITLSAVEARITQLQMNFDKFSANHDKILELKPDPATTGYIKDDTMGLCEERFLENMGTFRGYITKLTPDPALPGHSGSSSQHGGKSRMLPRIELKQFSGNYADWYEFRDIFKVMVLNDAEFSNVEKLQYLKMSVTGDAAKLLRNITVTDANFARAWLMMTNTYENKRALVNTHITALYSLKPVSSESADELRRLLNDANQSLEALETLGRKATWEDLVVHHIAVRMDPVSRRDWENSVSDSTDPPSYKKLEKFIQGRIRTLEILDTCPKPSPQQGSSTRSAPSKGFDHSRRSSHHIAGAPGTGKPKAHSSNNNAPAKCRLCQGKHQLLFCEAFRAKTPEARKEVVFASNLCLNCLGPHKVKDCQSTKLCQSCQGRHHTMLHGTTTFAAPMRSCNHLMCTAANEGGNSVDQAQAGQITAFTSLATNTANSSCTSALLATARVIVSSEDGRKSSARALIDQGSQVSLISERLAQRLHLERKPSNVHVDGVGEGTTRSRGWVKFNLAPRFESDFTCEVQSLVLPKLTAYQPQHVVSLDRVTPYAGLELADPHYTCEDRIDIILGVRIYSLIMEPGLLRGSSSEPLAQKTKLGWILSGASAVDESTDRASCLHISADDALHDLVKQMWEQEDVSTRVPTFTQEEIRCEEHYRRTTERDPTGRYVVRLPFKGKTPNLGNSLTAAKATLLRVEQRCRKEPALRSAYQDFLNEYHSLGHMEPILSDLEFVKGTGFVLPHHGVVKESSTTTKMRVVFNGSQKTDTGISLNDELLAGPNLVPELAEILLRWRSHRIVFSADIEKMYRQVKVHQDDQKFQRILWRDTPYSPIKAYQLTTVTYGLKCAPFLAVRTLQQLAEDEAERFPEAASVLLRDFYVDDVLSGAEDLATAMRLRQQLFELLRAGGFLLRKWISNDRNLLHGLLDEHLATPAPISWQSSPTFQLLGLTWQPELDAFVYNVKLEDRTGLTTKRIALSLTAQLFDPLGWLSPVTIVAKIFLQSLWLVSLNWDDPLPDDLDRTWRVFYENLTNISQLTIPRWIFLSNGNKLVEFHGFADASERAYAAVLYARVIDAEDNVHISLLSAKTKVAPLKQVSLPRLELCAAALLVKLAERIVSSLKLERAAVHLYSDSTVTLSWIQGQPHRWKTYVANRVAEIQRSRLRIRWHHVVSADNPADCASRGIIALDLLSHRLWWTGPRWLSHTTDPWTDGSNIASFSTTLEQRTMTHVTICQQESTWDLLYKYSSLQKLLRVTAWCLRFINTMKQRRLGDTTGDGLIGPLIPREVNEVRLRWIKIVQEESFSATISSLKAGTTVAAKDPLIKLAPELDGRGLLRVGGRLQHSSLDATEKHPFILPRESFFTELVIAEVHARTLHGGVQLTLSTLRREYWVLKGRSMVKTHINKCMRCFRQRATPQTRVMGHLPTDRTTVPPRAFSNSGVDYAGPIQVRTAPGRGYKSRKAYIGIFVCLATRAVHIELVSDYTADAFIAAYRRFTARRGICASISSDCGTTFVGADSELRALFSAASAVSKTVADTLARDGTLWKFNPPGAPHFGGIWEAAVKSAKYHLKRVIGDSTLTSEEMETLLAQVESVLNSRPLCAVSDDPSDLSPLTPGHFLVGHALTAIPEPSLQDVPTARLSRWQQIQQMKESFWNRWSSEYLQSLQVRNKWYIPVPSIQENDLVLIKNELTPPTKWPLGRIVATHPGSDGRVRVVTIKTAVSILKRPITKVCLLPQSVREEGLTQPKN